MRAAPRPLRAPHSRWSSGRRRPDSRSLSGTREHTTPAPTPPGSSHFRKVIGDAERADAAAPELALGSGSNHEAG
jgi:hypothetical protein